MSGHDVLFYLFSAFAIICALLVIANPFSLNPVTSAMFLVLTIMSMAALFVLLEAFFLAAVQILVYAGAVMVLFLFVIMLLDLKAEERRRIKTAWVVAGLMAVGAILLMLFHSLGPSNPAMPAPNPAFDAGTLALGRKLFSQYLLPFELVSVVLLVAMVGVILLSKRDLK